ncbi:hypothetical protein PTTG_08832 [Puccinia triticina 1-1 BBBD Race 1]|uniref:Uncharacterized protein n=1 Tax=Puccinia triticina (isolate 1-1 / race 1 (BBBD)) TaxID=630390 RepID=A0A180GVZ8_PUCT1|nr:hypothetical protein PTTG_08832 [Puccinia triticina 1-1 BBBD Race 1]
MEIEPFLVWINGVEIFFTSKEITEDWHKTLLIGRLILETNLLSFYQSAAACLLTLSWTDVKDKLFDTALPSDWTRVLGRQCMIDFEGKSLTDYKLAEGMTFGVPNKLEQEVYKLDLLKQKDFKFKEFVRRVGACYEALPKKTTKIIFGQSSGGSQQTANTLAVPNLPKEEYVWRIQAYLDSLIYRGPVEIPTSFIVPPKPADYVAPKAWTKAQAMGQRLTSTQPGGPVGKPAGVAGVEEDRGSPTEMEYEEYYTAAISSLLDIEATLRADVKATLQMNDGADLPSTQAQVAAMAELLDLERRLFWQGEAMEANVPLFKTGSFDELTQGLAEDASGDEGTEDTATNAQ